MEITGLAESIVEYLFLSSALILIMGILSFFALRVFKIQGKPKLWICSLLVIIPLIYPVKVFVPEPITVPVPQKVYQSIAFQPVNRIPGENQIPGVESLLVNGAISPDDTITVTENTLLSGKPAGAVSNFSFDWKMITGLIWVSLFLFFLFRLIAITYNMNRLLKLAIPVTNPSVIKLYNQCAGETGMGRTPQLLILDGINAPMVMGFLNPVILLPGHLMKPEFREGLRFALLHELKHARQHHNRWLLIESVIGAAYFFHPVYHWAKKKIHEELEQICDRHVIQVTSKSTSYADFLLHEIWEQSSKRQPALALPFITESGKTTKRVRSILDNVRPTLFAQIRGKAVIGFILISFLTLLFCGLSPYPRNSEKLIKKPFPAAIESMDNSPIGGIIVEMEKKPVMKLKTERILPDKDLQTLAAIEKFSPGDNRDISPAILNIIESETSIKEVNVVLREESAGIQAEGKEQLFRLVADAIIHNEKKPETQIESNITPPIEETLFTHSGKNSNVSGKKKISEKTASYKASVSKTGVDKYLGDPFNEISFHNMVNIKIINSQTVLFIMRNDDLYLARLSEPCLGLLYTNIFKFDSLANNLTRFDRIYAIIDDQIMDTTGMLGEFYPYHYEGSIFDAIKFLKNNLLEELIAEGFFRKNVQKG